MHSYAQRTLRTTAALFFAASIGLSTHSSSAQIHQASLEELATTSTSVVVGKTTDVRSFWNAERTRILTEVTLQVDNQVAGAAAAQTVITIPGGRVGNALYEVSDMPVFVEGEEVVVFLWQDASGRNLVTGGSQGRIGIEVDAVSQRRVAVTSEATAEHAGGIVGEASDMPAKKVPLEQLIDRIRSAREQ